MTTVGWVGLGKLGLPCAVAMASRGVTVIGYDINPSRQLWADPLYTPAAIPASDEPGFEDAWRDAANSRHLIRADHIDAVAAAADLIFVCVQTPHPAGYDGSIPVPEEHRSSFDYTALRAAVASVVETGYQGPLVVMSTVTTGTMDTCIRPLLAPGIKLIYNPAFPAMGSVIEDYLNPALVLIGIDEGRACWECANVLIDLYRQVCRNEPAYSVTSIPSAELTKVFYNTIIGAKIVLANAAMEMCHLTGADVDEVTDTLALATDRIWSPRYFRGGMGDGGACHPRDMIAMDAEAQRLGLSHNPFGAAIQAREDQTRWLADLTLHHAALARLDTVVVLGKAYKAGTALTDGSAAVLLAGMLGRSDGFGVAPGAWGVKVLAYDPLVDGLDLTDDIAGALQHPAVFVLATPHEQMFAWELPPGSVLIDPWRTTWAGGPGVTRIQVGSR